MAPCGNPYGELAQVAWNLERGMLVPLGEPSLESIKMSVVPIEQVAGRGPYHADIYWNQSDGTPRGPFELIKPAVNPAPTYPMLWAHDAKRERMLMVEPDSEGQAPGRLSARKKSGKRHHTYTTTATAIQLAVASSSHA